MSLPPGHPLVEHHLVTVVSAQVLPSLNIIVVIFFAKLLSHTAMATKILIIKQYVIHKKHLRTSGRRWWRRFGCVCPLADVLVGLLTVGLEPLDLLVVQGGARLRVEARVEPVGVRHRPTVRPRPDVVCLGQTQPEIYRV